MQDEHAAANGYKRELAELVAANRFMETTSADGTGVCFMTPSLQWGYGEQKRFRMWAMEKHIIDAVILLPKGMLSHTSIPLASVILKSTLNRKMPSDSLMLRICMIRPTATFFST